MTKTQIVFHYLILAGLLLSAGLSGCGEPKSDERDTTPPSVSLERTERVHLALLQACPLPIRYIGALSRPAQAQGAEPIYKPATWEVWRRTDEVDDEGRLISLLDEADMLFTVTLTTAGHGPRDPSAKVLTNEDGTAYLIEGIDVGLDTPIPELGMSLRDFFARVESASKGISFSK